MTNLAAQVGRVASAALRPNSGPRLPSATELALLKAAFKRLDGLALDFYDGVHTHAGGPYFLAHGPHGFRFIIDLQDVDPRRGILMHVQRAGTGMRGGTTRVGLYAARQFLAVREATPKPQADLVDGAVERPIYILTLPTLGNAAKTRARRTDLYGNEGNAEPGPVPKLTPAGRFETAQQAVAWTFGFDNPDDYAPQMET